MFLQVGRYYVTGIINDNKYPLLVTHCCYLLSRIAVISWSVMLQAYNKAYKSGGGATNQVEVYSSQ